MTREELIKSLTLLKEQASSSGSNTFVWDIKIDSFNFVIDSAIKALDQEPILDKIRAQIVKYEGDCRLSVDEYPSCKQCTDNVFETIYAILGKYKAESEAEDED